MTLYLDSYRSPTGQRLKQSGVLGTGRPVCELGREMLF